MLVWLKGLVMKTAIRGLNSNLDCVSQLTKPRETKSNSHVDQTVLHRKGSSSGVSVKCVGWNTSRNMEGRGERRENLLGKRMLANPTGLSHQDSGAWGQLGDGGGEHDDQLIWKQTNPVIIINTVSLARLHRWNSMEVLRGLIWLNVSPLTRKTCFM